MKSLDEYVESYLNFKSAEQTFMEELASTIGLKMDHIREIKLRNVEKDTKITQIVHIRLTGENKFYAKDLSKIEGLMLITPNQLEIEVGEIPL